MSTDAMDDAALAAEVAEHGPASGGGFSLGSRKVQIIALVVVVMAVQGALLYFLLPRPGGSGSDAEGAAAGGDVPTVEVAIDSFNCTNHVAAPGTSVHVTFRLVAIVASDQQEWFYQAANKTSKARVREAVVKVARSASMDELNDPGLSTLKRRVREEINKVLRKSAVIEVVVSDFKTMEQ